MQPSLVQTCAAASVLMSDVLVSEEHQDFLRRQLLEGLFIIAGNPLKTLACALGLRHAACPSPTNRQSTNLMDAGRVPVRRPETRRFRSDAAKARSRKMDWPKFGQTTNHKQLILAKMDWPKITLAKVGIAKLPSFCRRDRLANPFFFCHPDLAQSNLGQSNPFLANPFLANLVWW